MTPFPDVVRIEPAGRCNFKCVHCPVGVIGNTRPMLSYHDFVEIFDRLPFVPRVVVFYHGGEPLLNHALPQMVKYTKDAGVRHTVFNTNASLLTLERGRMLAEAGLDELRVSFDGTSAEENDAIRLGSNFAKHAPVVRDVAQLLRVVIYNVQFTAGETPEIPKYLSDFFGKSVEYRTEAARQWSSMEADGTIEKPAAPVYCPNLWETFSILSNGDVVRCCEDILGKSVFGNVLFDKPMHIWERMSALRRRFENRQYDDLCANCYRVKGAWLK